MFTPKNIQGALEELYDLCDPDYMVDMLVNYSEEFDDISPALLAKSFQKNAEMISEYRVSPVIFWLWDWARMIFVLCPRN